MPRFKNSDDLERLTSALKRHGIDCSSLGHHQVSCGDPTVCTNSTHRCHHATHAYTGEACSKALMLSNIR